MIPIPFLRLFSVFVNLFVNLFVSLFQRLARLIAAVILFETLLEGFPLVLLTLLSMKPNRPRSAAVNLFLPQNRSLPPLQLLAACDERIAHGYPDTLTLRFSWPLNIHDKVCGLTFPTTSTKRNDIPLPPFQGNDTFRHPFSRKLPLDQYKITTVRNFSDRMEMFSIIWHQTLKNKLGKG